MTMDTSGRAGSSSGASSNRPSRMGAVITHPRHGIVSGSTPVRNCESFDAFGHGGRVVVAAHPLTAGRACAGGSSRVLQQAGDGGGNLLSGTRLDERRRLGISLAVGEPGGHRPSAGKRLELYHADRAF